MRHVASTKFRVDADISNMLLLTAFMFPITKAATQAIMSQDIICMSVLVQVCA